MQKRYIIWAILMLVAAGCIFKAFSCRRDVKELILLREKSCFSEFSIVEDQVLIRCEITVKNPFDAPQQFTLEAVLPEDVKGGLLKKERITGWDKSLEETAFTIEGEKEEHFTVIFVGAFAGNPQKQNRNLPEITISRILCLCD